MSTCETPSSSRSIVVCCMPMGIVEPEAIPVVNTLRQESSSAPRLTKMASQEEEAFRVRLGRILGDESGVETAKRIGVSQPTISRWRTGERVPDVFSIARICRSLGISADELLGVETASSTVAEEAPVYVIQKADPREAL